jgi:hypothetical protein
MINSNMLIDRRAITVMLAIFAVGACGEDTGTNWPRPTEPLELSVYDIVDGPVDRASALNVVSGVGSGFPLTARVDQTQQWDMAFGMIDGEAFWMPRGFFEGLEPTSGILATELDFDEITTAPDDKTLYEYTDPLPIVAGNTYIIRSRNDPTTELPCRIYAKVRVNSIQPDPGWMDFIVLWNPNCDDTNLTLGTPE